MDKRNQNYFLQENLRIDGTPITLFKSQCFQGFQRIFSQIFKKCWSQEKVDEAPVAEIVPEKLQVESPVDEPPPTITNSTEEVDKW